MVLYGGMETHKWGEWRNLRWLLRFPQTPHLTQSQTLLSNISDKISGKNERQGLHIAGDQPWFFLIIINYVTFATINIFTCIFSIWTQTSPYQRMKALFYTAGSWTRWVATSIAALYSSEATTTSTALCYILCYLDFDQNRNRNPNNRDHLVGQPTR